MKLWCGEALASFVASIYLIKHGRLVFKWLNFDQGNKIDPATDALALALAMYLARNNWEFWQTERDAMRCDAMQDGECTAVQAL